MIFRSNASIEIEDWITLVQVEVIRVTAHKARLERIQQRALELRKAMGPRYLCHEKNRVRRLDGRSYRPIEARDVNLRSVKRAA